LWPKGFEEALDRLDRKRTKVVLLISIGEKKLRLVRNGQPLQTYRCSTGKHPPSCVENSLGTPLGLHCIGAKIGQGAAPGTVFVSRESTGQTYREREDFGPDQRMLVTTRILRLRGLEPGHNTGTGVDTWDRYIYLHGTTHPERFPENLSAGCITLLDDDLIALFDATPEGSLVWIEA
jgi:lipoprotein-anchoring transpeptidase ErfK/SrfK